MRYLYLFMSATLVLACGSSNQTISQPNKTISYNDAVSTYAETITAQELRDMLYVYASDEFEGRDTGEPGQKKAAEYLKQKYVDMNIASPLGGSNYFQTVPLEKRGGTSATITIGGKIFENFENHVALTGSNLSNYQVKDIVYAGYGIDAENYSDYREIDVSNKIVLIKAGEPKDDNGNYVTSGTSEPTKWINGRQALGSKLEAARQKGAQGVILLDTESFPRYATWLKGQQGRSGRLSLKSEQADMFALMVNETLATALYADIITSDKAQILNTTATIDISSDVTEVISENVVAYIKGSEKPDEVIVISAHLDHVGIEDGQIYNGADDDGSGTVAIVEIAQAFKEAAKNGYIPKRTILFLHVTGEEKGLLGSAYYTDIDPIFPLDNTVANLNIDMIGRTDPKREGERNYVYLIGSDKLSTELHEISEDVNNKHTQIELDYTYNDENDPNRFYYRSDHYNFAKNNIPVIFYFNGTHADYHQPSDTPDKIEYDLLENRTKLVFYTAWEIANRENRIVVDKAN